jgi:hypothetical protein
MNVLYFASLWIAIAASILLLRRPAKLAKAVTRAAPAIVCLSIAAIVALYCAQLILAAEAFAAMPGAGNNANLPIHVLQPFSAGRAGWLAIGAAESLLLAVFFRYFRDRPWERTAAVCGFAALAILSLTGTTIGSPDVYEYVAHSLLGASAYDPPHVAFSGSMSALNSWGVPVMRSTYGPLWTFGTAWLLLPIPSLLGKIVTLRIVGLFSAVLCGELLARSLRTPALRYLVLLNPYVLWVFVANAHNDLLAADLALLSGVLVSRHRLLATIAAVAAGSIKLPLLLVSCLPVEPRGKAESSIARWAPGVAAIVVALGLSWLSAGRPYFGALAWYASYSNEILLRMGRVGELLLSVRIVTALLALVVIVRCWTGKRFPPVLLWSIPCLGSGPFQQYQAWSVPAAAQNGSIATYLIALPTVMAVSTFSFFPRSQLEDFGSIVVLIAAFLLHQAVRFEDRMQERTKCSP